MKSTTLLTLIIVMLIFTGKIFTQDTGENPDRSGDLTVIVEGFKNDKGTMQIGLFVSKESWDNKIEKFKGAILPIQDKKAEWKLINIPFGKYAIKLFHDENNDNKLNTNFLGMPKESFAFSNNAKARFGPPGFDRAKFVFDSANSVIRIRLK